MSGSFVSNISLPIVSLVEILEAARIVSMLMIRRSHQLNQRRMSIADQWRNWTHQSDRKRMHDGRVVMREAVAVRVRRGHDGGGDEQDQDGGSGDLFGHC